jgi:glyoxylase-like metal-dependent hydrolase (beta-lactamase superfamily II)
MTTPVGAWNGGRITERAHCVLAPNPGPLTLDGTNTWVLREPDGQRSVVIDPGPLDELHLAAVVEQAGDIAVVLLTHRHLDHSEAARVFAERVGCGVRALDPEYRLGSEGLGEGDVVDVDGLEIRVIATPGHTSDSLSFVLSAEHAVLTGDTVLGRGTSVVAHPDGALGPYLESLRRLRGLAERHEVETVLPGHGPVVGDALAILDGYLAHRAQRLDQVREALAAGATDPAAVVRRVYVDVDERLWPAAELSVRAQLDYLAAQSPTAKSPPAVE